MKTKMIIAIAALMVFGVSMVAVAYTKTAGATRASASCCKADSCPMKSKSASTGELSCCDDCDCCSGGSCPMKSKSAGAATDMKITGGETTRDGVKGCDCSCCKHDMESKTTVGV